MTRKEAVTQNAMDYEKAYKAVLQTATQWIKDGCTDKEKICLESVFPELRESEDEKIRKEIIDFIQWAEDRGMIRHDYHQAKRPAVWLAWLEKQKERTSCIILKAFENSKTDYSLEEREEASDYSEKVLPTSIALGESEEEYLLHKVIEAAYIAGQKEQPAQSFNQEQFFAKKDSTPFEKELFLSLRAIKETKPSDEEIWLNVKEQLTPVLLSLVQKEQKVDIDKLRKDIYQSGYNDGYRHGKEDAQKEQKPAECADDVVSEAEEYASKVACGEYGVEVTEAYIAGVLSERNRGTGWSEEDEKILDELLDHCNTENATWYKWLKSLRPQPKVELTLLDENIIEAAVAFVEQNNHFNCWRGIDKHTVLKALRSLKPHWRPSEEQMNALNALNCHGDLSYVGQQNQLISLYNDLKKLI